MGLKLNYNPTPLRAVTIGILLCLESMLGGLLIILQQNRLPNQIELLTLCTIAIMTFVTFFAAFLRTGEVDET